MPQLLTLLSTLNTLAVPREESLDRAIMDTFMLNRNEIAELQDPEYVAKMLSQLSRLQNGVSLKFLRQQMISIWDEMKTLPIPELLNLLYPAF